MKKIIQRILLVVLGIIIGIVICEPPWQNDWFKCIANWANWQDWGSIAEWVGSIGIIFALVFAYGEIINFKKQFKEEHQSKLQVYANWKAPLNISQAKKSNNTVGNAELGTGVYVHIIPINIGLASRIYRYFGICRAEKVEEIISLVPKAKEGKLNSKEEFKLLNLICYDTTDVGQTDEQHDMNVTSLLYPDAFEVFQVISSNSVGKILNKDKEKIENKLKVNVSKDRLAVLYADYQMKIYSFEVGLYRD